MVSKQAISQYEHGARRPDQDTLLALCDIFNVSADYLLGVSNISLNYIDPIFDRLNESEHELLAAYREADPGTRAAVRKLLDIEEKKSHASAS